MFIYDPPKADVLLITDTRWLADANYDRANDLTGAGSSVLRTWKPGLLVWGREGWADKVARVSLFEFGQTVKAKDRGEAKDKLETYLARNSSRFSTIIVLQSRSKSAKKVWSDEYSESSHTGSVCWKVFEPPAPIHQMAGTFWETPHGTVLPLQNPQNVDYVYGAMVHRWLTAVKARLPIFKPPSDTTFTEPGPAMLGGLTTLLDSATRGTPIAFDIESYSTRDLITVIGLSDGKTTCSVPWEPFTPYGQSYTEPGFHLREEGQLVRRIFLSARSLVGHNIEAFDLPYLTRKNIPVGPNAVPFDTYAAHGVLYNQFRHGLQATCAYEFVVPPWKTLHKKRASLNGMDPDLPEAWIQDPHELRTYNSLDTFYNWWLGMQLANYGGVSL